MFYVCWAPDWIYNVVFQANPLLSVPFHNLCTILRMCYESNSELRENIARVVRALAQVLRIVKSPGALA